MSNSVNQYRVDSGQADLNKFRGLLPYLRQEQINVRYIYDCLCGNPLSNLDKLKFKDGEAPKQEGATVLVDPKKEEKGDDIKQ